MIFYVYMLKSVNNKINKTYVGYTNNLNQRLKKHNLGVGAKSTRGYKWKIIYKKKFYDKRLAMSFEYRLKKSRKKKKYTNQYQKMKIASILPYKENYSKNGAGAVSLWISDFLRDSIYRRTTFIIGNTNNKDYLTKNYININIDRTKSKFNSTTKEYSKKIIEKIRNYNFDIIELHNRPIMVQDFFGKINSKIILYFHNDPTTMKGAKSVTERLHLLKIVDKIIFISKWVKTNIFKIYHSYQIIRHK